MTGWAAPDQDVMRRIVFHLQQPDWRITSPARDDSSDGHWHASDGTTDLSAPTLEALLDELDWFLASYPAAQAAAVPQTSCRTYRHCRKASL